MSAVAHFGWMLRVIRVDPNGAAVPVAQIHVSENTWHELFATTPGLVATDPPSGLVLDKVDCAGRVVDDKSVSVDVLSSLTRGVAA